MNRLYCNASATALLAASVAMAAPALAQSQPKATNAAAPKGGVAEIVVTATRRSENLQDVPVAVQALDSKALDQRGVAKFSDYLQQLPNVTAGGGGPGQRTIYIRGLASTTPNLTTAGVAGLAPNVSMYLDEQPLSQPGRNLDVYAADLARIEVLAGPQGTLFGASSQAGVIRLITNAPKLGVFEGSAKGGVSFTKSGAMSENAQVVLNVPVTDTIAVRGVVYLDHQGGYIDNVPGTRDASASARFRPEGTVRENGVPVNAARAGFQAGEDLSNVNFISANNSGLVNKNFNGSEYRGFRLTALWEINSDWSIKVAHTRQGLQTDGVFFEDPDLGDLQIQRYEPDHMEDDFSNTAWTLDGRIGPLSMVYTGAFTDRSTDQTVDYSDYLFVGQYLPYYICDASVSYPGASGPQGTCQAPNLFVKSHTETTKFTQELRFSTPDSLPFRVTAGGFYSNLIIKERNDFHYPGSQYVKGFSPGVVGFAPNYPFTTGFTSDAGPFPPGVIFRNDVKRSDKQFGLYGEASYDLVPDLLTVTFGARYYDTDVRLAGSANGSFCNLTGPNGTDTNSYGTDISDLYNGDGQYTDHGSCGAPTTYTQADVTSATPPNIVAALNAPDKAHASGVIVKGTVTLKPTRGVMFYATYSQGFRPGLLNRPGGAQGPNGYTVPYALETDNVDNYEIGWKTSLFNNQLVFNGAAFYVDIKKLQTTIFDPSIVNLFFSDNAANAWTKGVEGQITYAPYAVPGLTVQGAFSFLDTKITKVLVPTNDVHVGDHLAYAPPFQGNLSARYQWGIGHGLTAHIMPSVTHSASKFTDIVDINRLHLAGYTTVGLTMGIAKDDWTFEIFGKNLTDKRAQISGDFYYDRPRVVVNRPLTVGARASVNF